MDDKIEKEKELLRSGTGNFGGHSWSRGGKVHIIIYSFIFLSGLMYYAYLEGFDLKFWGLFTLSVALLVFYRYIFMVVKKIRKNIQNNPKIIDNLVKDKRYYFYKKYLTIAAIVGAILLLYVLYLYFNNSNLSGSAFYAIGSIIMLLLLVPVFLYYKKKGLYNKPK